MQIILGDEVAKEAGSKYTVLELDTFSIAGHQVPVTAYALIDLIEIDKLHRLEEFRDLHQNLMKNYKNKNWKFCEDAIEHLTGKWQGELDTFYSDLLARVLAHKKTGVSEDWDGVIERTGS